MNARDFLAMIDLLCPIPEGDAPIRLDDERPSRRRLGIGGMEWLDEPHPFWAEEEGR
jgi:hypothetical protein